jgi:quercetin dioxygenase-like cupin family protein
MAQPHVQSGQVTSVRPLGAAIAGARTTALLKARQLEVVRLVLHAGQALREHAAPGEVTVHCLEGRVDFSLAGVTHRLEAGDWIHLAARAPHALHALDDASLLVTICLQPGPAD